jgi:hypothetical protein
VLDHILIKLLLSKFAYFSSFYDGIDKNHLCNYKKKHLLSRSLHATETLKEGFLYYFVENCLKWETLKFKIYFEFLFRFFSCASFLCLFSVATAVAAMTERKRRRTKV